MTGRRIAAVVTVAVLMGSALAIHSSATPRQLPPGVWTMIPPTKLALVGTLTDRRLAEASGAAASRTNPGLIWTIGDSGNPPDLYAIDSSGALRADFGLAGATNVDWEEVAVGPCGLNRCVYIADTGDNGERRSEVIIYRVAEPVVGAGAPTGVRRLEGAEWIRLVYPDRAHDVEAMAVTPGGEVLLVTKGRSGGVLLFSVSPAAWASGRTVTATQKDSLPIVAAEGMGRLVTGMAISPDGRRLVVRTYREIYPFELRADGGLTPLGKPTACDILGREPQGEGITFLTDRKLLLTSERGLFKAGTVFTLECAPVSQ